MLFKEINPFVRQALNAQLTRQNKTDTFNRIKTVDCRLFYIFAARGKISFESASYELQAGTIILFRADTAYTWEVDSVNYYAINFDYTQNFSHIKKKFHPISIRKFSEADIIEKATFQDEPLLNEPLVLSSAHKLGQDVKRIVTEYLIGNEHVQMLTSALLKSLIVEILRKKKASLSVAEQKTTEIARNLIEYITNDYANEITYESLQKKFHFNPAYLNRIFKAATGNTLHGFLLEYRLNTAMEILTTQNLPVHQVAALCGFPNPYHFTKAFRKFTGVSPTEYRKRNLV
ncbi:MAG: helix-turn-helix transcriptional regulator [Clostridia bacterium]|nr:helix-turn-helix transcriptional regulator [Clostridia bacterium]